VRKTSARLKLEVNGTLFVEIACDCKCHLPERVVMMCCEEWTDRPELPGHEDKVAGKAEKLKGNSKRRIAKDKVDSMGTIEKCEIPTLCRESRSPFIRRLGKSGQDLSVSN
jgi:hypothetical protein